MALQTVCCFFALCLSFASALSNLDAREPIVRQSPANDTDYFGYSVILHQIREPDDGDFSSFLESTRYDFIERTVVTHDCKNLPC